MNEDAIAFIAFFASCVSFIALVALVIFLIVRSELKSKKDKELEPEENPIYTQYKEDLLNSKIYEIQLPKGLKWNPAAARNLVTNLLTTLYEQCIFQIVAEPSRIVWRLFVVGGSAPVADLVRGSYPDAEVIESDYQLLDITEPIERFFVAYKFGNTTIPAPIRMVDELKGDDPLILITNHMDSMPANTKLTYSIYVTGPTPTKKHEQIRKMLKRNYGQEFAVDMGLGLLDSILSGGKSFNTPKRPAGTGRTGRGKFAEADQKFFEHKFLDQQIFDCYVAVEVDRPLNNQPDLPGFVSIATTLQEQYQNPYNFLYPHAPDKKREDAGLVHQIHTQEQEWQTSTLSAAGRAAAKMKDKPQLFPLILSTSEIAALWHLPTSEFTAEGIEWVSGAKPSRELIENRQGAILGDASVAGQNLPIRIHPDDRETHMNIIGLTGVGKSTFMHNLIHQDIQSGKGVAVLDPHGKLVRDVLRLSIPDERKDDLIVLDLANEDYPPPLNPLMGFGDVGEVVSLLEMVEGKIPPVVSDTLIAAFVTISKEKAPTVRDVIKLFTDGEYRYKCINKVDDVITQEYWEEFESLSRSQQELRRGPVLHRLRQFYRNPILHPIFCHPKPLDFNELIRQRKIVLMSLGIDERKVPASYRNLVGATLVKQFQMAAMSSFQNPTEYFLYIDEVQNFVTSPLDKIFEEARKYKLRLIVANQYLRQLGSILDSIMGTVGATVVFQASLDDSRKLGKHFAPEFEQTDLAHMDKFHAAVKTRYLGNSQPAFKIGSRPEPQDLFTFDLEGFEAAARETELRAYAIQNPDNGLMHVDEVMAWLKNRYPPKVYKVPSQQEPGDAGTDSWVVTEDN